MDAFQGTVLVICDKGYTLLEHGLLGVATVEADIETGTLVFGEALTVNPAEQNNLEMARLCLIRAALETADISQL